MTNSRRTRNGSPRASSTAPCPRKNFRNFMTGFPSLLNQGRVFDQRAVGETRSNVVAHVGIANEGESVCHDQRESIDCGGSRVAERSRREIEGAVEGRARGAVDGASVTIGNGAVLKKQHPWNATGRSVARRAQIHGCSAVDGDARIICRVAAVAVSSRQIEGHSGTGYRSSTIDRDSATVDDVEAGTESYCIAGVNMDAPAVRLRGGDRPTDILGVKAARARISADSRSHHIGQRIAKLRNPRRGRRAAATVDVGSTHNAHQWRGNRSTTAHGERRTTGRVIVQATRGTEAGSAAYCRRSRRRGVQRIYT